MNPELWLCIALCCGPTIFFGVGWLMCSQFNDRLPKRPRKFNCSCNDPAPGKSALPDDFFIR